MPGLDAGRLCLVSDRRRLAAAAGRPEADAAAALVEQASAAAACGIGAFQIREPDLDAEALLTLTRAVIAVLGGVTQVLVNDRADIAAAAGAGVHLKERSLPADRIRAALPAVRPIWRAVHDLAGVRAAGPVDALVAGTVLPTRSKDAAVATLGAAGLSTIAAAATVPVYAIGGLSGGTWPSISACGVHGCAAIRVFVPRAGEDIAVAVRRAVRGFAECVD